MFSGYSLKFIIGIILLFSNQPVGWGGVIIFTYLARKTGKKLYYGAATGFYLLSWGMVGLGLAMTGPEGISFAKRVSREYAFETLIAFCVLLIVFLIMYRRSLKQKKALNA